MTYNFDPDRWLSLQLAALADRCRRGELDAAGFERERELLEKRHERLVEGLDRSFELPGGGAPRGEPRDSEA